MMLARFRSYLLPIVLAIVGLALLLRIVFLDASILLPEHSDIVILVLLLSTAIIIGIHTIVRISLRYLRFIHVQKARHETLAEHRRFLKRLDHELKNPLTTLQAGLKTLALTELDKQQRDILQTMETETLRLSRLITDLRKLGALETETLDLQPVNIETLISNVVRIEQERNDIQERQFVVNCNITQATWLLDEDLLSLAIHNLLDNAFKYTRLHDTITLDVQAQQELIISVSDTGIGIKSEALPYIWEELYRAEQIEKIAGSGIGLALVQAIIENHAGTVSVNSHFGEGTTVIIRIPARLPN